MLHQIAVRTSCSAVYPNTAGIPPSVTVRRAGLGFFVTSRSSFPTARPRTGTPSATRSSRDSVSRRSERRSAVDADLVDLDRLYGEGRGSPGLGEPDRFHFCSLFCSVLLTTWLDEGRWLRWSYSVFRRSESEYSGSDSELSTKMCNRAQTEQNHKDLGHSNTRPPYPRYKECKARPSFLPDGLQWEQLMPVAGDGYLVFFFLVIFVLY